MKWVRLFYKGNDQRILDIQRRFVAYFDMYYPPIDPPTRLYTLDQVPGFGDSFYNTLVAGGIMDKVGEYLYSPVHPIDNPI